MKKKIQRWICLGLIASLLISLLPAVPAYAATPDIRITNLYSPGSSAFDETQVTRLTVGSTKIVATFADFDPSKISELYYEVVNETTGQRFEEKLNKARQTGTFELTFDNVGLTEGLNRITIKYGETNPTTFPPAYVYYTAVSNLSDLKIDNDPLVDGQILPTIPRQSVLISGVAPNATEVRAYVNNETTPHYAQPRTGGVFFFIAEDVNLPPIQRQSSFGLTPGDNLIRIEAKSNSNTYFAQRNLIYDNGEPFAYSATILDRDTAGAQPVALVSSPTVTPVNGNVTISANLKIDIDASGVTQYVYGQLDVSGQTFPISFPTNANDDPAPLGLSKVLQTSRYVVYRYEQDVTLSSNKTQYAEFSFTNRSNNQYVVRSKFPFTYINPNAIYVESVHLQAGTIEVPLAEAPAGNPITERPIRLIVRTKNIDNSGGINVYLGQSETLLPNSNITRISDNEYEINLDSELDGRLKVKIVPYTGSAEDPYGQREYYLDINTVPYIIVNSLYNGMIVRDLADIICSGTTTTPSCITGRIVNLPAAEYPNVVLTLNGVPLSDFAASIDAATGTFRYPIPSGTVLDEGNNVFEFWLKLGGVNITKATYNVFKQSQPAPAFNGEIVLHAKQGTNKFIEAQMPGMYATHETYVSFSGQFNFGTTGLKVTVRKKDKDGNPVISYDSIPAFGGSYTPIARTGNTIKPDDYDTTETANSGPYYIRSVSAGSPTVSGSFTTFFIKLMPVGETIIEFEIRNASGTTVTKTITIAREPLPYTIVKPVLIKNLQNEDQVNVNSNYLEVEIEAEGADQVLFGKDAAVKPNAGVDLFRYEVKNLKAGKNTVKFTVVRGKQKINGSFIVYNTNTPVVGAQHKQVISSRMRVFDNKIELEFPRGTLLMRNNADSAVNQLISSERSILFGIADPDDGRVDKYKHPTAADREPGNMNPEMPSEGPLLLREETGRFRPASELFWIDAGTIKDKALGQSDRDYLNEIMTGGGRLPYDPDEFWKRQERDFVVPTQRGELTLKYDPNIARDAWKYVTVMHFDPTYVDYRGYPAPRWRNLGGVVDPKNNTITVPFERFGYYRVMYMSKSFDDVTNHDWARDYIDILYTRGIMNKKGEYSFIPNDPISRGEFVTMLVKIFELPLNYEGPGTFSDVYQYDPFSDGLYEYKYIETAARAGVVRGTIGGMFSPGNSITRQDAAVMIARIAELKLTSDAEKSLQNLQKTFTDADKIDIYARASVEAVAKAGYIDGKENVLQQGQSKTTVRFDPLETLTRAEAAAIAVRVMQDQKKIPK